MSNNGESTGIVRVLAYRRTATSVQGPLGASLEEQRTAIERYCEARGLPRPVDHAEVAPGTKAGPELGRLVADLGPGDVVIVARVDRIARDPGVIVEHARAIREKGAALISIADDLDTRRPEAEVLLSLLAGGWRGARGLGEG